MLENKYKKKQKNISLQLIDFPYNYRYRLNVRNNNIWFNFRVFFYMLWSFLFAWKRTLMKKNKIPEKLSPALLTIEQTCQLLNVSRAEFYRLKAKGKIGPQPVGLSRKYLYRKDEIENWIKAGLPNKDIWRIIMKKEQDYKNNVNININNFNGVLGNVQSENLQNENNTNCNNFKNNKDVLKNRNIAQALFTFIKKSIGFLGLIKSFILKLL